MPSRPIVVACALLGATALPLAARAQQPPQSPPQPAAGDATAEARLHFDRGVSLLNVRDFDGALAEFQRSFAILPRPSTLLNIGVALQSLHRYPEAVAAMERYLREAPNLTPARRAEVQSGIDQMRSLFARVELDVGNAPAGSSVRVDGVVAATIPLGAPIEVGPGRHLIEVESNGRRVAQREITIASGEQQHVRLEPASGDVSPAGSPAVPAAPAAAEASGTLTLRGIPAGAVVRVDHTAVDPTHPLQLERGTHAIEIRANGYAEWHGTVAVEPGATRTLDAHLASAGGIGPGPFAAGLVATVLAGAGTAVMGVLTLQAHDEFQGLTQDDPHAAEVANRGETFRTVTNGLLITTAVLGAVTVFVFTRTRFGNASSTVDVAGIVLPDSAAATVRVRF